MAQIVSQTRPGTTAIVRDVTDRRRSQDQLEQWRELFEHAAWGVVAGPVPSSPEQAAEQKLDLMNPTFAQMHGYTREELAGKPFRSVFSDAAWEEMPGHIARAHQQGSYSFESEHVRADGSTFPVHTNVTLIRGPHGDVRYRVAHVEDITRRKATEEALRQAEQRFRTAFDRAPAGMALISTSEHDYGRVLRVNEALCEITGRDRETLLAITMTDIAEPDDPSAQAAVLAAIAAGEQADHFDAKIMRPDGQVCEVAIRCSAVPESGEQAYFIEHVVDISQRRRFEEQLKRLADHDPLTGLFNRRRFGEELTRHLRLAGRHRPSGAVMLIDLDNFKYVNDTLGHQAGDRILHDAAQLLKARLRASDTVARLGGDEFVALLPDADAEAALTIARALGEIFEASQLGGHTRTGTRLTLSIGVKTIDRQACQLPWEKLLAEADIALYEAKEQGRNQTVLSGTDIEGRARMQQRLEWSERLRTALELDSLTLYAQPIIALQHGGALTSYELLVRLIDADGTVHGPEQFLPIARRFGLSRRLDRQVITKAMRLAARSPGGGQLAINLSADSTSDPELPDFITRHVHALGIDPSRLIFEITETAAIENLEHAAALAERLHDLGCLLALDDFGVGFGSFHYLKHIPIDFVKIDGGFIRELCDHPGDQVMVKAMVHAAQGLGKKTIAEWVSDERTKRRLTGYGVDYVQGYHIGPPQPATELILQPPRGKANRRRRAGA